MLHHHPHYIAAVDADRRARASKRRSFAHAGELETMLLAAARALTPRRVAAMEPTIRATVDELLGAIDAAEPFDLVSALTFPLPATVIF